MIMQAVVEFRGVFMDIKIGWPGKVHDARVFVNSSFFRKGSSGTRFPSWLRNMAGLDVPLVILGDPAGRYPLLPWLMNHTLITQTPHLENVISITG